MKRKKCVVLFSGGLDSRLAIKIMQERRYDITAVYCKLPFNKDIDNEIKSFLKKHEVKLKLFNCTKGKLLQEYLKVIRKPKYGRGKSLNPCVDCRLFVLDKAKKFADKKKIELIVTGEVLGERPMSQTKRMLELVERKSELGKRLVRPLGELGIEGRKRDKQIALAKKFDIDYPHPAGGCLLCEKALKNRFEYLLERKIDKNAAKLFGIGKHFVIGDCWIVIGKDEKENKILSKFKNSITPKKIPGPTVVYFGKCDRKLLLEMIKAYSKKGNRKDFDKFKL